MSQPFTLGDVAFVGVLTPGEFHLYNEGDGASDWVEGHSLSSGTQAKEADHLRLSAAGPGIGSTVRTYVTDVIGLADLTDIDEVEIDWTNDGTGGTSSSVQSYLIASTNKTADHSTFDARLEKLQTFARTVDVLDVSALTGNHYIRIHARASGGSGSDFSRVRAYRVTLK